MSVKNLNNTVIVTNYEDKKLRGITSQHLFGINEMVPLPQHIDIGDKIPS